MQVYSAKLRFDAHLSGLRCVPFAGHNREDRLTSDRRYLLYHHPILVFILFTPTFLFFELVAAALIWALFVARSTPLETSPPSTIDGEPPRAPRIKREFESRDRAEEREGEERRAEAEVRRGRRMEMEELGSESSTETGEESLGREEVKDEEEEEEGTIGGVSSPPCFVSGGRGADFAAAVGDDEGDEGDFWAVGCFDGGFFVVEGEDGGVSRGGGIGRIVLFLLAVISQVLLSSTRVLHRYVRTLC